VDGDTPRRSATAFVVITSVSIVIRIAGGAVDPVDAVDVVEAINPIDVTDRSAAVDASGATDSSNAIDPVDASHFVHHGSRTKGEGTTQAPLYVGVLLVASCFVGVTRKFGRTQRTLSRRQTDGH
jgi:hypothetical protein